MNIFRARKSFVVFFDESFSTFRLKFERLFFINFLSRLNDILGLILLSFIIFQPVCQRMGDQKKMRVPSISPDNEPKKQ